MATFYDLREYFAQQDFKVILAGDAEPRVHRYKDGRVSLEVPSGGVGVTLDAIAKAANATYIARGKDEDEKRVLDTYNKVVIKDPDGSYTLKRLFFTKEEMDLYYYGFSNQALWPLCHVAFERPDFNKKWYEGYKKVNTQFAQAINQEVKGKTFIWLHDYQLSLVPSLLRPSKDTIVSMFWHIPWPTWEVFRIVPFKKELLESLLQCQFLGFHRGYHVRNFLDTVRREFPVQVDEETSTIFYKNNKTIIKNLPLGIDTDVVKALVGKQEKSLLLKTMQKLFVFENVPQKKKSKVDSYFDQYKVILGVDRLDYTKGLLLRLRALDVFFETYPNYRENVVYIGILAPSRETIATYKMLKKEVKALALAINKKYGTKTWQPIYLIYRQFSRQEVISFYYKADVCLVTPRDDGMNLVSKEFVVASYLHQNPGMLVLSRFAGSAIDLTESLIINPYDPDEVADAIKRALEMSREEKIEAMKRMAKRLDEKNVYAWAMEFVQGAQAARK